MPIYRRVNADGKPYPHWWYRFRRNGRLIRVNTKQKNKTVAKELEDEHRSRLARGEMGLRDWRDVPTLKGLEPRFIAFVEAECKKGTGKFYKGYFAQLLAFAPLAETRLDQIDEALVEKFIAHRRKALAHPERKNSTKIVAPATVNRSLATLRRALRKAQEWKIIARVPRIKLLKGERYRKFVLPRNREAEYLEKCPALLKDLALLMLDTGLRVGEAVSLKWVDVHVNPVGGAKFGYLQIHEGKTDNAKRTVSLTERVVKMLRRRADIVTDGFVFVRCTPTYLCRLHARVREKMELPVDFVIHSLRHTMLTRLGEAGVDAFTIMRVAGHGSITVSQRYIHPSSEAMERAFEKLEAANSEGCTEDAHEAVDEAAAA